MFAHRNHSHLGQQPPCYRSGVGGPSLTGRPPDAGRLPLRNLAHNTPGDPRSETATPTITRTPGPPYLRTEGASGERPEVQTRPRRHCPGRVDVDAIAPLPHAPTLDHVEVSGLRRGASPIGARASHFYAHRGGTASYGAYDKPRANGTPSPRSRPVQRPELACRAVRFGLRPATASAPAPRATHRCTGIGFEAPRAAATLREMLKRPETRSRGASMVLSRNLNTG